MILIVKPCYDPYYDFVNGLSHFREFSTDLTPWLSSANSVWATKVLNMTTTLLDRHNLMVQLLIFMKVSELLYGTRPLSQCYHDKMKTNLIKITAGPHLNNS